MPEIQTLRDKGIQHILDMIVAQIRKHLSKEYSIFLFGSWAQSDASATSDIDIAIQGPQRIDSIVMVRIRQDIEELPTLRKIDVIDVRAVDEHFRQTILKHPILLN